MNIKIWLRSVLILVLVNTGLGQIPEDWVVDVHAFEHTMTLTGQLTINGVIRNETSNAVAAFHGDECRGVVEAIQVGEEAIFFLLIYANGEPDSLKFRAWDAEVENIIELEASFVFESGSALGNVDAPFMLSGTNPVSYLLANDDSFQQEEDAVEQVPFDIMGNDVYDRSLAMVVTFPIEPLHGMLFENVDQTFSYSSETNFFGQDSFQYRVSHAYSSDSAWVMINVTPVDDPLSEFHLLQPTDGSVFESGSSSMQDFSWELPMDYDGDPITYSVYVYDGVVLDTSYFSAENSVSENIEDLSRDRWLDWQVTAFDGWGWTVSADTFSIHISSLVDIIPNSSLPGSFSLSQNYPNPFNPSTIINYSLADPSVVSLIIYDMSGKQVVSLVNTHQLAGYYNLKWDGTSDTGNQVSTGMYLCRLQAGSFSHTVKMVYLP